MDPLNKFLNKAGYTTSSAGGGDIRVFLAGLLQITLSFVGVLFFIMILFGGFKWLTAGGNEEQVQKAQKWMAAAFIGLLIIVLSLAIVRMVVGQIGMAAL